jgi:hypothetical protein
MLLRAFLSILPEAEVGAKALVAAAAKDAYCLQFSSETSPSLEELLLERSSPLAPEPLLWLLDDELSPLPLLLEESSFFLPPQATRRTTSEMETNEKRSLLRDTGYLLRCESLVRTTTE